MLRADSGTGVWPRISKLRLCDKQFASQVSTLAVEVKQTIFSLSENRPFCDVSDSDVESGAARIAAFSFHP
jgi:hypothetical protein